MKKSLLLTLALTPILAIACTKPAVANDRLPVDVTLAYENSKVTDNDGQDSLRAEIGTQVNKFNLGLTTLTNNDTFRAYGAYAGIPLRVQGTKLTVEPRIAVEQYRDESEIVGSIGVGAQYEIVPTVALNGRFMYSEAFTDIGDDNTTNLSGESYMVGLTKRF